jgi:hypothetical protein
LSSDAVLLVIATINLYRAETRRRHWMALGPAINRPQPWLTAR